MWTFDIAERGRKRLESASCMRIRVRWQCPEKEGCVSVWHNWSGNWGCGRDKNKVQGSTQAGPAWLCETIPSCSVRGPKDTSPLLDSAALGALGISSCVSWSPAQVRERQRAVGTEQTCMAVWGALLEQSQPLEPRRVCWKCQEHPCRGAQKQLCNLDHGKALSFCTEYFKMKMEGPPSHMSCSWGAQVCGSPAGWGVP